ERAAGNDDGMKALAEGGRPLRLVIVDDSAEDRFLVVRELERQFPGAQIERVTGEAAFAAALDRDGFDLVVTDYSLGWTDGIQVLHTIKARLPDVPVIMFTGTGSEEVAVEAMKAGLDDYIL